MGRAIKHSATVRFTTVLKVVVLCVVFGGSGLGYVWQQKRHTQLSRQLKERQEERFNLQEQVNDLQQHPALALKMKELHEELRRRGLELVKRRPEQVIRIRDLNGRPDTTLHSRLDPTVSQLGERR